MTQTNLQSPFYLSSSPLDLALEYDYDLALTSALDLAFTLDQDHDYDRARADACVHAFTHDRDLTRDLDLNLDLSLTRDLTLALALNRARDLASTFTLGACKGVLTRARDSNIALDPKFCQILQDLDTQVPPQKNVAVWRAWWKNQGQSWSEEFRSAMIQYRNVGHDWSFTPAQIELLQQYLVANLLLVNCLNSNCYVSRDVRAEIEETLLLPMAEIEVRSVQ